VERMLEELNLPVESAEGHHDEKWLTAWVGGDLVGGDLVGGCGFVPLGAVETSALEVFLLREVAAILARVKATEVKLLKGLTTVFGFEPADRHWWRNVSWAYEVRASLPVLQIWFEQEILVLRAWWDRTKRLQQAFAALRAVELPSLYQAMRSLELWSEAIDDAMDDLIRDDR